MNRLRRLFSINWCLWCVSVIGLVEKSAWAQEVSAEEQTQGFVSLFDGQSLAGWTGAIDGYEVVDGTIRCIPEKGGNLLTAKEYTDFELRLDFLLPPGGNNGIGLRAPAEGHVGTLGLEVQILDNTAEKYKTLAPYQYHGSIYGLVPARRGFLREVGVWNEQTIICTGRKVKIHLNGDLLVDADLDDATRQGTMDGKEHPGAFRTSGRIGFLGHDDPVAFRRIRIREIR